MTKSSVFLLLFVFVLVLVLFEVECSEPPNWLPTPLWPKPQFFSNGSNSCVLNPNTVQWRMNPTAQQCQVLQTAITNTQQVLFAWGSNVSCIEPSLFNNGSIGNVETIQINLIESSQQLNSEMIENYTLTVNGGVANCSTVTISAQQVWGAMRGLTTLTQMTLYNRSENSYWIYRAPWLIEDFPRFRHRGILIDAGLHFLPKQTVMRTIEGLSANKMNVLHWHATEASSMPLESKIFPDLAEKGAYDPNNGVYYQEDIEEIVNYGFERGVRVMLELDMPGHAYAWGIGYPELIADCPEMYPLEWNFWHSALDPTKNYTYEFLEQFINEMFDLAFIDDFIHLGGDEVVAFSWNCWNSTADIRQFMEEYGLDLMDLYAMFEKNVFAIAENRGRSPVVWDEVFEYIPEVLTPDSVVQVWRNESFLVEVLSSDHKVINSAQHSYYLNLGFDYSRHYIQAWDIYRKDPLPPELNLTAQQRANMLGVEGCIWGEDVDQFNIDQRLWFRGSVLAERLWTLQDNLDTSNLNDTTRRVIQQRCKLLQRGLNPSPYEDDDNRPFPMRSEFAQCELFLPPNRPNFN